MKDVSGLLHGLEEELERVGPTGRDLNTVHTQIDQIKVFLKVNMYLKFETTIISNN